MTVIAPLTDDERTVLMIAIAGNSMIPIVGSRWRETILALATRGFLNKWDDVNYIITAAGREASDAAEDDVLRDFLKVGQKYGG